MPVFMGMQTTLIGVFLPEFAVFIFNVVELNS